MAINQKKASRQLNAILERTVALADWDKFKERHLDYSASVSPDVASAFARIRKLVAQMQSCDFDAIDDDVVAELIDNSETIRGTVENYTTTPSDSNRQDRWGTIWPRIWPAMQVALRWLPLLALNKAESLPKMLDDARANLEESTRLIAWLHEQKAKQSVEVYSTLFSSKSSVRRREGWLWFRGGVAIAVLIAGLAGWVIFEGPKTLENYQVIQWIAARVILFSLLTYAMAVCLRGFRSNMHLSVLDEHRSLALQTFERFVDASKADEATKHQVLLETTKCIFAAPSTGYVDQKDDGSPQFVEIIKALGPSKPGG